MLQYSRFFAAPQSAEPAKFVTLSCMQSTNLRDRVNEDGYALVENILDDTAITSLLAALQSGGDEPGASARRRGGALYARRNLLTLEAVRQIARSPEVRGLVEEVLGPGCFAVRGLLFDKTREANWKVIWHQDLSIAVRERKEVPGYGPWSSKAGVTHVQPPMEIMERMLAVPLHLDACDASNGPLRVLPGSHQSGRLDADSIAGWRERTAEVACLSPRGGALLMRPLLLHASSPALVAGHRRVLHLEWAAEPLPLPQGLEWQDVV